MLGWELPPFNSGGLGEACYGLAKAMSKKGANITFVLPRKLSLKVDFMNLVFADIGEDYTNIESCYTTAAKVVGKQYVLNTPTNLLAGVLSYSQRIGRIAMKYPADIIHSHDWLTFPAAIAAKKLIHKPLVSHIHSTEYDRTGGIYPNPDVYEIEKNGVDFSDKVIPVSNLTRTILEKFYGVPSSKIEVVYNGVDKFSVEKLSPVLQGYKKAGYKIVLYLGRITLQKGPEYFVRAASKVLKHEKKVLFVVTGSGDMQEAMMNETANLGIMKNFFYTGFLRGEERDRIFQSADLYVMPSVSEPFGITSLEAIANGTPVMISNQSGVSEVLKHALKVDFWDIDEMANKIVSVVRYKALKNDLQNESAKEIRGINWDKAADTCLSIYSSLL